MVAVPGGGRPAPSPPGRTPCLGRGPRTSPGSFTVPPGRTSVRWTGGNATNRVASGVVVGARVPVAVERDRGPGSDRWPRPTERPAAAAPPASCDLAQPARRTRDERESGPLRWRACHVGPAQVSSRRLPGPFWSRSSTPRGVQAGQGTSRSPPSLSSGPVCCGTLTHSGRLGAMTRKRSATADHTVIGMAAARNASCEGASTTACDALASAGRAAVGGGVRQVRSRGR